MTGRIIANLGANSNQHRLIQSNTVRVWYMRNKTA